MVLACVGTQCVPGVATRVVAKIYRPIFFLTPFQATENRGFVFMHMCGLFDGMSPKAGRKAVPVASRSSGAAVALLCAHQPAGAPASLAFD